MAIEQGLQHNHGVVLCDTRGRLDQRRLVELTDRPADTLKALQPEHDWRCRHRPKALIDRFLDTAGRGGYPGQSRHGLLDKDVARTTLEPRDARSRGHLHCQDAVPAELEERVVDANVVQAEDLGIDVGQNLLGGGAGCPVPIDKSILRRGKRILVELSVDRQRKGFQDHDRHRHHVGRQPLRHRGAQGTGVGSPDNVADQALVSRTILPDDHDRLLDIVECHQRRLDFTEFDAITPDLDLLVRTSQILQLSIETPAHQITGAIHPRAAATERARHKSSCCQRISADIAIAHTRTGDIQLSHRTGRHRA
ncbi:hypothetical protein NJBCHELONAE_45500 [Mycobacteroides chelonae]|nr:hypothetical protein NJBCHELONAE_45500 [Mycobacteroides chelonae]